jgi:D-serine deaminase-like pyridoxal phosphate-dependent protein
MATTSFYPLASIEDLKKHFVGKSLKNVNSPAAVLDIDKIRHNCSRMLDAVDKLAFGWRAHIKTHKV